MDDCCSTKDVYIFKNCFIYLIMTTVVATKTNAFEFADLDENNSLLTVSTHDLTVLWHGNDSFEVLVRGPLYQDISISLVKQYDSLVQLQPNHFTIKAAEPQNQTITIIGKQPGHLEITAKSMPNISRIVDDLFVRVTVANSEIVIYVSLIFGWMYFAAWSISYYPQIYWNFKQQSVVGLNFDFVILTLAGYLMYSVFNCGLYWVASIRAEYERRHPRSLIPVLTNDIVFSLHATFATLVLIFQCLFYERGDQKVSKIAVSILSVFAAAVLCFAILAAVDLIYWLDFLYYCSYIKLIITVIQYVPQVLLNYRRKSTEGWCFENIILDVAGSIFSMLQMIANAYNYDDWVSIFGDPTKFGLGMITLPFDIIFILQHCVFYKHTGKTSNSSQAHIADDVQIKEDKEGVKS